MSGQIEPFVGQSGEVQEVDDAISYAWCYIESGIIDQPVVSEVFQVVCVYQAVKVEVAFVRQIIRGDIDRCCKFVR